MGENGMENEARMTNAGELTDDATSGAAGDAAGHGGSDIGDRAQTGDLVSDRELGMTEPLGAEERASGGDLGGSTWGSEPGGDPGSALGNPGDSDNDEQT
jgi:hypothetical protein